jgi:hypothetical protein
LAAALQQARKCFVISMIDPMMDPPLKPSQVIFAGGIVVGKICCQIKPAAHIQAEHSRVCTCSY